MMRLLSGLVAALALVAATVYVTRAAGAESNGGVRVMPLGDSITDGFAVPGGYRIDLWQKLVAAGYRVDFVGSLFNGPSSLGDHDHEGHSGWRIDQIDANIVTWLRTYRPRTILLHIGTNDIYQNPNGASSRLAMLIDRITGNAPDAEVFVATIIPLNGADPTVRAYNSAIPGIVQSRAAAGRRVHLVDMYSALTTADLADGVHPNAGGYGKMANVWYNALRSVPGSLEGAPTPTPTPPGQDGACGATYRTVNTWSGGFQAEVTVRNSGSTSLNGWTVRMTLAAGQAVTNLWGGVATGAGGAISVRNASYNGSLAAAGTTTFGYVATGNGATAPTGIGCSSP
ncbi:cellulose binding domain-containing protein [Nonomuraea sp. NPDC050153]|uniref:cellulose binding domain-containing protein n=1 Tax=Nonomuraea sp. NPDC050153 TaxID=3364359 RepID=UPI0037BC23B7